MKPTRTSSTSVRIAHAWVAGALIFAATSAHAQGGPGYGNTDRSPVLNVAARIVLCVTAIGLAFFYTRKRSTATQRDQQRAPGQARPGTCPLCGLAMTPETTRELYGHRVCRNCSRAFSNQRHFAQAMDTLLFWSIICGAIFGLPLLTICCVLFAFIGLFLKDGIGGQSPGKGLFGVQVMNEKTGKPAGLADSFKRNLPLHLIPFAPVVASHQTLKGYRLGDGWSNTKVIWLKYASHPVFAVGPGSGGRRPVQAREVAAIGRSRLRTILLWVLLTLTAAGIVTALALAFNLSRTGSDRNGALGHLEKGALRSDAQKISAQPGTPAPDMRNERAVRSSAKHYTNGQAIPDAGTAMGDIYILPDGGCYGGEGMCGIRWTNGGQMWFGDSVSAQRPLRVFEPGSPATK